MTIFLNVPHDLHQLPLMYRYYFTGTQTYKYLIGGLVMKSSYSVSVTAVSEGTAAKKAAVKKIKTTNIPAYRLFN